MEHLSPYDQDKVVSNAIYELEPTTDRLKEVNGLCRDPICRQSYKFTWARDEVCQGHFTCSSLSGNSCGDFGVDLTTPHEIVNYCYENVVVEANVTFGQTMEVAVWYRPHADFNVRCYVWCRTGDGDAHLLSDSREASKILIDQLVRTEGLFLNKSITFNALFTNS